MDIEKLQLGNQPFIAKTAESSERKEECEEKRNYAPRHRKGELFLCGPIPWNWLCEASQQGGKGCAIQVALALWFLSGLNFHAASIKLTRKTMELLGIERNAGYRGLRCLEEAGLVSVVRRRGACPLVALLDIREAEHEDPGYE